MCWNIEVSMASAAVGWAACLFLLWRQRSARDTYYAKYLFTFTFTQIADAYLWTLNEKAGADAGMGGGMGGGLQACESYQLQFGSAPTGAIARPNFLVSKYVIPLIVFSQHAMQLSYPSEAFKGQRTKIIAAHAVPCLVMSFCFGFVDIILAVSIFFFALCAILAVSIFLCNFVCNVSCKKLVCHFGYQQV